MKKLSKTSLLYLLNKNSITYFKDENNKAKLKKGNIEIFAPLAIDCKNVVKKYFNINL